MMAPTLRRGIGGVWKSFFYLAPGGDKQMNDGCIIGVIEAISLQRSSKRLNRLEVMATLDQGEAVINWLIVERRGYVDALGGCGVAAG